MPFIWGWLASAVELSGMWMIGNKKRFGFLVSIIGNAVWIAVVLLGLPATGLLLVVVPALIINIRNFLRWKSQEVGVKEDCSSCDHRVYYDGDTVVCSIWADKYRIQRVPHNIKCKHYEIRLQQQQ